MVLQGDEFGMFFFFFLPLVYLDILLKTHSYVNEHPDKM